LEVVRENEASDDGATKKGFREQFRSPLKPPAVM
jgi:hypothetical protein